MRCLHINKQTIYYALYNGYTEDTDSDGNYTGEKSATYSTPVEYRVNVSEARQQADTEPYGVDAHYTKMLVTSDMACPINEETLIWIDRTPTETQGETVISIPHNYKVVQVSKSLNSIMYLVKGVSIE